MQKGPYWHTTHPLMRHDEALRGVLLAEDEHMFALLYCRSTHVREYGTRGLAGFSADVKVWWQAKAFACDVACSQEIDHARHDKIHKLHVLLTCFFFPP